MGKNTANLLFCYCYFLIAAFSTSELLITKARGNLIGLTSVLKIHQNDRLFFCLR